LVEAWVALQLWLTLDVHTMLLPELLPHDYAVVYVGIMYLPIAEISPMFIWVKAA
jgi:hypothetical protein